MNFERLKWGGVRLEDLSYIRFDLEQLAREDAPTPQQADWEVLEALLDVVATIDSDATAGRLVQALKPVVPGPIPQIRQLVDILATAGVLRPLDQDRTEHPRSDWRVAGQWRGGDRYDRDRVGQLFPRSA